MTLRLYQLDGCPYCERVVEVLEDLDLAYESVWVEAPHSRRDEVKRVSGQRTVPVLVDEDRDVVMSESERIVDYLATNYGATAEVTSQ
ncbi:MAG: glutaredoxin family protein [Halobacteriales archaeon]